MCQVLPIGIQDWLPCVESSFQAHISKVQTSRGNRHNHPSDARNLLILQLDGRENQPGRGGRQRSHPSARSTKIGQIQRLPRQKPQRWGRWEPSPTAPCCMDSCTSWDLGSGLEIGWGAGGAARRGSFRCLSPASAGAGFFSVGSVAVASADNEFVVTVNGDAAGFTFDAAAAGAAGLARRSMARVALREQGPGRLG